MIKIRLGTLSVVIGVVAAAAAALSLYARAPARRAAPQAVARPAMSREELAKVELIPVREGTRLVDFELENLAGERIRLSGLAGSVIFLNFWATWCPPCRAEMPSMERLSARLAGKGLKVIAVDLQEDRGTVEAFVREHGLRFEVLLDQDGVAAAAYGVRSIPTTYIVDRDGTILAGRIGGQEWDSPEQVAFFERLLAR